MHGRRVAGIGCHSWASAATSVSLHRSRWRWRGMSKFPQPVLHVGPTKRSTHPSFQLLRE
eukprot:13877886-Heterocapsa_arctica.AAC.1